MSEKVIEEFMTVGDYAKVYDFLFIPTKQEFIDFYSYINSESYDLSMEVAMQPKYLADLMRQAENLAGMEMSMTQDEILESGYLQEDGTDYISADNWKTAIMDFIHRNYNEEQEQDFMEMCQDF